MDAYSRLGAHSRQRFEGAYSIILCLGWALIRGGRLIEALRYIDVSNVNREVTKYRTEKQPRNLKRYFQKIKVVSRGFHT